MFIIQSNLIEMHKIYVALAEVNFDDPNLRLSKANKDAIRNYYYHRCELPTFFLRALISNDIEAILSHNLYLNKIDRLYNLINWLNDNMPCISWGSDDTMRNWLNCTVFEDNGETL